MEHPKLVFNQILKSLKWETGRIYEDHQNSLLYVVPADIFQEIRIEMRAIVGSKVAKSLLYGLNQISADMIIQDGKEMGFAGNDLLRYFLAIMTLFGWGDVKSIEFNPDECEGSLTLARFPQSRVLQTEPVHDDFSGILARAIDLSFGKQCSVAEVSCCEVARDTHECIYEIHSTPASSGTLESQVEVESIGKTDAKLIPVTAEFEEFRNRFSMPEDGVLMLSEGDKLERIVVKDVVSINSMLLKTADIIGWKTIGAMVYRVCRNYVIHDLEGRDSLTLDDIRDYLHKFSLFGWGLFEVQDEGGDAYQVTLENAPFTAGFPLQQTATDYLVGGLLAGLFEKLIKSQVTVKELECTAKGDPHCVFDVTPLQHK
ncbi:MAG TPA: V4R domain-containing protein [Candidatus Lokiarchaeia archaeon]|nr:V4R domain-containing protein [Candidatus Lokiarchaeia archaeon]